MGPALLFIMTIFNNPVAIFIKTGIQIRVIHATTFFPITFFSFIYFFIDLCYNLILIAFDLISHFIFLIKSFITYVTGINLLSFQYFNLKNVVNTIKLAVFFFFKFFSKYGSLVDVLFSYVLLKTPKFYHDSHIKNNLTVKKFLSLELQQLS